VGGFDGGRQGDKVGLVTDLDRIAALSESQRRWLATRLDAAGADRPQAPDRRLIAFVWRRPGHPVDEPLLRRHLAASLPDYMIPATIVLLDGFPRTASGKVDHAALQRLAVTARVEVSRALGPPRDDTERAVAAVWTDLLGAGRVGRDENFFDLGGHSLLLVRLQSRLRDVLGVELTIADLFRFPTVATLAEAVRARHTNGTTARPDVTDLTARAASQRAAFHRRALAAQGGDEHA
jgi:acyl carrier protein